MSIAVAISSPIAADPAAGVIEGLNELTIEGTLTLTGNYGAASGHGDIINFTGFDQIKSNYVPKEVFIFEQNAAGTAPYGYQYLFSPGTDQSNGKLVVLGTAASGAATTGATEYTNGTAYSSGSPSLSGAVLRFRATFVRI